MRLETTLASYELVKDDRGRTSPFTTSELSSDTLASMEGSYKLIDLVSKVLLR
jgi:hypothetical protein